MNNNYKNALDKIAASDSFKAELIEKMQKKRKRPKLPYIAAVAACLAATIAITIFLAPMAQKDTAVHKNEHNFCLTAYAAEGEAVVNTVVNRDAYVRIGEICGYFKTVDWSSADRSDAPKGDDIRSFMPCFRLNLTCEGEDIDTVTFTANDSRLWINDKTSKYFVIDSDGQSDDCKNGKGETGHYYKSFTVDYDNQVKSSPYGSMELAVSKKTYGDSRKLPDSVERFFDWFFGYCRTQPDFNSDSRYYLSKLSNISNLTDIVKECDKTQLYTDMLSDLLEDATISVTVKYSDGTKQTETLGFRPTLTNEATNTETDPVLTGKIV